MLHYWYFSDLLMYVLYLGDKSLRNVRCVYVVRIWYFISNDEVKWRTSIVCFFPVHLFFFVSPTPGTDMHDIQRILVIFYGTHFHIHD